MLQTVLWDINTSLTIASDSVTDTPEQEIDIFLLENLLRTLLHAASEYQANKPHPNILLLLFADINITYIIELLQTHRHYTELPPEIPI